jgi:hypothetical protein
LWQFELDLDAEFSGAGAGWAMEWGRGAMLVVVLHPGCGALT